MRFLPFSVRKKKKVLNSNHSQIHDFMDPLAIIYRNVNHFSRGKNLLNVSRGGRCLFTSIPMSHLSNRCN